MKSTLVGAMRLTVLFIAAIFWVFYAAIYACSMGVQLDNPMVPGGGTTANMRSWRGGG